MANMKKQYRLSVEGKSNFTPVGPVFETPCDARQAAPRINAERQKDGLKPVVALKQYVNGKGWEFLYYLQIDDSELMTNPAQKKIDEATTRLRRADAPTTSLFAASCSLASIIVACEFMIGIIQSQENRIGRLEDILRTTCDTERKKS